MSDESVQFSQAMKFYHERNFSDAEKIFRQILSRDSGHLDSLHMMAVIGYEVGRYDFAEELMRIVIEQNKNNADFYFTLGSILDKRKNFEEALYYYQEVIKLKPDHFNALLGIAVICRDQGMIFRKAEMLEAAASFYTRALAIRADEDIYHNLGYIYDQQGRYRDTIAVGHACAKRYPKSAKNLLNIAVAHNSLQEYQQAMEYYKKALLIEPEKATTYANMSSTLKNLGEVDESILVLKKAISLSPDTVWFYNNLLLTMVYAASVSPEELADTSREFGEKITNPLRRNRPFTNSKKIKRKLRIGYISPDFRDHAVNYFLAPVYECDKNNFEIFAYSKNEIDDYVTEQLKTHFDHWRDIKYKSDDVAADIIEEDKIDILVDLAGHTARNGLMIFARKPAPIQITWLGHPATSGMAAMDYRITDSYAEPEGLTEHLNTEMLWRMPEVFCVYNAHPNSPDVIDHPPFEDNGYITFGCFNNFTKVSDPVLKTWAKIMEMVPRSRLLLEIAGIHNDTIKTQVTERLAMYGLPIERIDMLPRNKANQFVLYNKIDIALDPFPCVGGTTSMDTLWMGVPFVTLAGKQFVSRMGVTILTNIGLPQLIAETTDQYISIAVQLANDKDKLREIRHDLRGRMKKSPLMNQKKFARDMEAAYREMFKMWVESSHN